LGTIWIIIKIWLLGIILIPCLKIFLGILSLLLNWKWYFYGLRSEDDVPKSVLSSLKDMSRGRGETTSISIYIERDSNNNPMKYTFRFRDERGGQYSTSAKRDIVGDIRGILFFIFMDILWNLDRLLLWPIYIVSNLLGLTNPNTSIPLF